ncbi:AI-2E family transporter [Parendozoicomonas haliclonae]|uniref:Pheromone autoinducer 2 transporter n=2 Tax=Parendozoicomonas haliclonae TaxID=1960125 RepID=A0A1X7AHN7_9GAMM|nr:AI-2E family transporter [Parendozoicomonas haliclonae]SMA36507.1 pheromone autoinducer 2 transporter [Parendozoicomonas haliclonae]
MFRVIGRWFHRYFSDDEAIVLILLLGVALFTILVLGAMLAPVFAALVLAFVLQGLVNWLEKKGLPHILSVVVSFLLFVAVFLAVLLLMVPLVWEQGSNLLNELPGMVQQWQDALQHLPETYPGFISESQVNAWIETANTQMTRAGQWLLSFSLSKLPNLVGILIYLVLVPILVFFFLKDRTVLLDWFTSYLPKERRMINQVSDEMSSQIANYIRGKVIEIVIVGITTYIAFWYLGLNYAALLSLLVGLSVLIPYIGAAVVTIPIAAIGLFQWGFTQPFFVMMAVYGVIQALDGNVLVPLLFSEAVNLHPIAIIVAVLFFGGVWGFWGVFFAIPLATLIKAVFTAWPGQDELAST